MNLKLADVAALALDARSANLETGTITVASDGAVKLTIARLARGTQVLEHGHTVAVANRAGVAAVRLGSETTVLTLVRGASTRKGGRRIHSPARAPRRAVTFTG